jgi:hypothetical protein
VIIFRTKLKKVSSQKQATVLLLYTHNRKPEGKRPLGRPRRRWLDNIKMDLREIGRNGVDWMDMAQDRDQWRALVNTVLNLRVP